MTEVTIPEDYLPIVDGLLWKKILKEGSGESPVPQSNVNGSHIHSFIHFFSIPPGTGREY